MEKPSFEYYQKNCQKQPVIMAVNENIELQIIEYIPESEKELEHYKVSTSQADGKNRINLYFKTGAETEYVE